MEEVPLSDNVSEEQISHRNLSTSSRHTIPVHSAVVVEQSGNRFLVPIVSPQASAQEQTSTNLVTINPGTAGTGNMSLAERERLLQQQISRLLPAIQQSVNRGNVEQLRQQEHQLQQHPQLQQVDHHHQHHHQHGHSHPHTHSHGAPIQGLPPPPPHPVALAGAPPEDLAINMGDVPGDHQEQANNNNHPPDAENSGTAGRARRVRRQLGDQLQGLPGLGAILRNLEGSVPFLLLIFAKVMYNHRLGLLVFIAMFGTFYYANSSLKKLISLRDNQTWAEALSGYVWIFGFLGANIVFIYFVFRDQDLYKCLYLGSPNIAELDLWNLMWVTVVTDFVVKFGTISVKSLIAILPKHILLFKKKGKYFLFLEMLSQFYRCLLPVPHWAEFVLEDKFGGKWVAITLFIIYCVFKCLHVKRKAAELRLAFAQVRVDVSFGTPPNREEIKAFENTCPICQDLFTEPVKLSCKHVFCDDCICLWLDREKTCPMCRAHIVDNPIWRDGATSGMVQFY